MSEPIISAQDIEALVQESKSDILKSVIESIKTRTVEQVQSGLTYEIRQAVSTALGDIVKEEIVAHSEEIRGAIGSALSKMAAEVGTEIAIALTEKARENLRSGYHLSNIAKDLF